MPATRRRCRPGRFLFGLLVVGGLGLWPAGAGAQPPAGSALPNPRLLTLTPPGGKVGTSVEVSFTGTDVEEPQALLFSHPGLKAEAIQPPPPTPDPKKPAPKPAAPPAVTKFRVTIAPGTPLGFHDVRLVNKWGVSNPRAFVVGDLAEALEKEPNNDVEQAQRVELNTTVNGAIAAPTDVDYYVFAGKKGQRVLVSCLASSIDSRLRPGLELYGPTATGRKLASNRNYHGTDALLDATLPADGDYYVRVYQFTYTLGGPEYFYRLSVTTAPWIDAVFPPMVEPGKPATLTVYGRNLPGGQPDPTARLGGRVLEKLSVTVTPPADPAARQRLDYSGRVGPVGSELDGFEYRLQGPAGASNPYFLAYARAPVVLATGANATAQTAQEVAVPCEIAGRILKKGQRSWFTFSARKNEVLSIEIYSERLGAPTDIYCLLYNPAAKQQLAELDDNPETLSPAKFYTRNDDPPRFRFVVPADGKYQLMVSGRAAGVQAGPRHLYRVRITPEQPDFRLIVMAPADNRPDTARLPQNGHQFCTVLAWRLDGFNGPITLTAEGLPAGVTCAPVTLAPNLKQVHLVLEAAAGAAPGIYPVTVKGTAQVNGQATVRVARPASITWPMPPGQGVPLISRLDRQFLVAVREPAPYRVAATLDKPAVLQGDKASLALKLTRLQADFKGALQATAIDLPPNLLTVNNNQPINLPAGKDDITVPVEAKPNLPPGTYTIVLRTAAQVPFNKDPNAKQKPNINVVLPAPALQLTVLPKQVAALKLPNPNVTAKVGAQAELVVQLGRMYDYAGEFKVQAVLPPNLPGVAAEVVTVSPGKDEARVLIRVGPEAKPMNLPNLVVRATALVNGNLPTVHEAKFNLNIVK